MTLRDTARLLLAVTFGAAIATAQTPPNAPTPQADTKQVQTMQGGKQNDVLPEAPYVPLSTRQKFHTFAVQTYSPFTFVSAAASATYDQMTGEPYQYGGGMEGFGKRMGRSLADTEASRFFNKFLFASIFHQDPRYFPAKPHAEFIQRLKYAATRTVITRADSGKSQFNYSEVFGNLFTVSLSNAYYPERDRGFPETMNRFGGSLISSALGNVTREFWPDITRLFRRHTPKRVQTIQDKVESRIPPSLRGPRTQ